jgi:hypothetical protein
VVNVAVSSLPSAEAPLTRPSFQILDTESLPQSAFLGGAALAVCAFVLCAYLMTLSGNTYRLDEYAANDLKPVQSSSTGTGSGTPGSPTSPSFTIPGDPRSLTPAERHRIIQSTIDSLKQHYADPNTAAKIADTLTAHEKRGDYSKINDPAAFAERLTSEMRDTSNDQNLIVAYSPSSLSELSSPSPERQAAYRTLMESNHCTFEKVAILPRNVGYFKLNSFPDPSVCGPQAADAMEALNDASAVIFDLRDNTGGFPAMVMQIANFLFDHPEYMYNPRENTTERCWTHPIPGSKLTDKPVYILTSSRTASAAEHFTYDLKMLKRATVIGEKTAGAAHAGTFHRLDDHYGIGLTEVKPINPFSRHDWSGVGIEPDVNAKPGEALATAQRLASRLPQPTSAAPAPGSRSRSSASPRE